MHILLIHQAFAALDEAGGTRHYEMAQFLVRHGHRVTIIASPVSYLTGEKSTRGSGWVDRSQPEPGITILRTYTYPALHRSFVHRIFAFVSFMVSSFIAGLGVRQVDLIWGTSPPIFQGMTAWLLARLKRKKLLFEVRDLWPAFAIAVGVLRNPLLIRLSLGLEKFLYRHADQMIVNSPGYLEHVQQRGARQATLIPNGADPEMFDPGLDGEPFRAQHNLQGKFIVLYAGAHGMSNDLDVLLDAAAILSGSHQLRFVLVGDGKEKSRLQQRACELNLDNVLFLPSVPKNEMKVVLAAADACIAILKPIELYKTTYPNKVFDYMAAGRPVVLAIDGVVREVVEKAGAGIPVPPGNSQALAQAVADLQRSPEHTRQMGLAGRAYIETTFNRQIFNRQFMELCEKLVQ